MHALCPIFRGKQKIWRHKTVNHLLYEKFRMRGLFVISAAFVTISTKTDKKPIFQHLSNPFDENKIDFVAMDETWILNLDPKLKQERLR